MPRQLLRSAAISVLAACAAGCANTPAPKASSVVPVNGTAKITAAPQTAPITTVDASLHDLESELQRAQSLRAQGNLAEATRVLAQLVLVAPDNPRVVGEYGKVLVQQGRSDDAAAFLKRATELQPNEWTFYSALGVAYDQMDDRKDAKAAYEHALALHPGDATILNNYAVSRMLGGDYDAAQKLLLEAQAHGANSPKVASNLEWLAQRRARKPAAGAAPSGPAPQGPMKPPRILATATPQSQPTLADTDTQRASPPSAKVIALPSKLAETPPVPMASKPAQAQIPSPRMAAPKKNAPAEALPILANSSAKEGASGQRKIAAEQPAKSPKRKAVSATTARTKVAAVKSPKPAKAGPPALRTADQGE